MKIAAALLLVFLLLAGLSSAEKAAYRGFVASGSVIPLDQKSIVMTVESSLERIRLQSNGEEIHVSSGECGIINYTQVCHNYSYWNESRDTSLTYLTATFAPVRFNVTKIAGSGPYITGQEIKFDIAVKNASLTKPRVMHFAEQIPAGAELVASTGFTQERDLLVWQGVLDNIPSLSYTLRFSDPGNVSAVSTVEYFDGFTDRHDVFALNISVVSHIRLSFSLTNADPEVGQPFNLTARIYNTQAIGISDVSYSVQLPDSIVAVDRSANLGGSGRTYTATGSLAKNQTEAYSLVMRANHVGGPEIITTLEYVYDGVRYTITKNHTLNVKVPGKRVNISLNIGSGFESGQVKAMKVWIANPNKYLSFKDLQLGIKSNLGTFPPGQVDYLNYSQSRKIAESTVVVPQFGKYNDYHINLTLNYEDEFGNQYTDRVTQKYKVTSQKKLKVSRVMSKKLYEENVTLIRVSLQNTHPYAIDSISVRELVSQGLKVIGYTQGTVSLAAGSASPAYDYQIVFPDINSKQKYHIRTEIMYTYDGKEYLQVEEINVTVDLVLEQGPKLEVKRTLPEMFFLGKTAGIDYIIKNKGSEELDDVVITFPQNEYSDLVGDVAYAVDPIASGEQVSLPGIEQRRVKLLGWHNLSAAAVRVVDSFGEIHVFNTSKTKLNVTNNLFDSPMLIVKRNASKLSDSRALVTLIVTNIGTKSTVADIVDYGHTFSASIDRNNLATFIYEVTYDNNTVIPQAQARYYDSGTLYTAASEDLFISEPEAKPDRKQEAVVTTTGVVEFVKENKNKIYVAFALLLVVALVVIYGVIYFKNMTRTRFNFKR